MRLIPGWKEKQQKRLKMKITQTETHNNEIKTEIFKLIIFSVQIVLNFKIIDALKNKSQNTNIPYFSKKMTMQTAGPFTTKNIIL